MQGAGCSVYITFIYKIFRPSPRVCTLVLFIVTAENAPCACSSGGGSGSGGGNVEVVIVCWGEGVEVVAVVIRLLG